MLSYPKTPSTPGETPLDCRKIFSSMEMETEKILTVLATPIDWLGMTKPGAMVTWSRYSVPENDSEPCVTDLNSI